MCPPASGSKRRHGLGAVTRGFLLGLCCVLALPLAAQERMPGDSGDDERVMVGEDIVVGADEYLNEVVCIGCSIEVLGRVRGDAVAIGGSISVSGEVGGDAAAILGDSEIAGRVGGSAIAILGGVKLRPGAEVKEDVVAVLGSLEGESEATIGGTTKIVRGPGRAVRSLIVVAIICLLLAVVVIPPFFAWIAGLVLGEQRVEVLAETVRQRAGMSFVIGLAVVIGLGFTAAFLNLMVPAADLLLKPVEFVLAATGYAGISYIMGRRFSARAGVPGAILMGGFAVMLLQMIPILGWMLWFVLFQIAVGAAVLSGCGTSIDWLFARTEIAPMARPATR